jgi:hypothetical protein
MVERPGPSKAGEAAVSESAKARFESLADELAADPRAFRDLSPEERRARLRRVASICPVSQVVKRAVYWPLAVRSRARVPKQVVLPDCRGP